MPSRPHPARGGRDRTLGIVVVGLALLLGPAGAVESGSEPAGEGRRELPRLSAERSIEVTGRIARSTRGRPGPVRLILETPERPLAVLLAPDALCDRLDLSLEVGEEITVIGQEVRGARPLLVARAVVSAGRRVALRDDSGRWLPDATPPP